MKYLRCAAQRSKLVAVDCCTSARLHGERGVVRVHLWPPNQACKLSKTTVQLCSTGVTGVGGGAARPGSGCSTENPEFGAARIDFGPKLTVPIYGL